MIREGGSLEWLAGEETSAEDLALDHRMDISGSVYARMKELGVTQNELAKLCDMDRSQISRIITGKQNITLSTLAKLEVAPSFRMDQGFTYHAEQPFLHGFPISIPKQEEQSAPSWNTSGWTTATSFSMAKVLKFQGEAA